MQTPMKNETLEFLSQVAIFSVYESVYDRWYVPASIVKFGVVTSVDILSHSTIPFSLEQNQQSIPKLKCVQRTYNL